MVCVEVCTRAWYLAENGLAQCFHDHKERINVKAMHLHLVSFGSQERGGGEERERDPVTGN